MSSPVLVKNRLGRTHRWFMPATVRRHPAILGHALPAIRRALHAFVEDVVEMRRTAGTFVSATKSPLARKEKLRVLGERIDALLAEARQMDVSIDELIELLRQHHRTMSPQSNKE